MNQHYHANWRKQLKGKQCPCGQPAVRNKSGEFVCARCDAIEHMLEFKSQQEREIRARHEVKASELERFWQRKSGVDDEPPVCTYAREWIKRMFPVVA